MNEDEWVRKLNTIAREMDDLAGSVHPSVVFEVTAYLRKKYKALAQSKNVAPNAGIQPSERSEDRLE